MLRQVVETSRNFVAYRHLLAHMVAREVKGRFAGSSMGLLWSFLHPLIMLAIFLFVFVYIFKLRLPDRGGSLSAAIYLMAGLFPWMAMSEGLSRSMYSLIENANLIQKSVFPTEILPAKAVLAPFTSHGIAIIMLAAYAFLAERHFGILLYLPVVIAFQIAFTLGLGFILCCLSVFLRDTLQVFQLVISFWLYITPILYPVSMLPEWARDVMYANPVYPFVAIYQSLFLNGHPGEPVMMLLAALWTALSYATGSFLFMKLKDEFADWL